MLKRQQILLQLLADAGGNLSRTRLTQLSFLLSQLGKSVHLRAFYQFLPYLYGPYSFTLNHELDSLLHSGAIALNDEDRVVLTVEGRHQIASMYDAQLTSDLALLQKQYGVLDRYSITQAVEKKYPWFTINSKHSVMPKANTRVACANYTIGYQLYQVDGLLNFLLQQGIEQLVDTRLNPVSRRYGFHKSTLFSFCRKIAIKYIHVPELGVPSSWRQELDTDEALKNLFRRYETEILDKQSSILLKLANAANEKPSALMCAEAEHNHCHRSRLAARLAKINGLPILELNELYARAI
jgi:uncharacterized protein (DUF488 family)